MQSYTISTFLIKSIKPFKLLIIAQFFIACIFAIDLSLRPYLLQKMLDKIVVIIPDTAFVQLLWPAICYILVYAFMILINRVSDFIWLKLYTDLRQEVGLEIVGKIIDHSYSFYQNEFSGKLVNVVKEVMSEVITILKLLIERFFGHSIALIIAIYTLWQVDNKFATSLIFCMIVFFIYALTVVSKVKNLCNKSAKKRSQMIGYMVDVLSNIINVKFFSNKNQELNNISKVFKDFNNAAHERDWFFLKIFAFQGGIFVIYQTVCLWWLISGLQTQTVSIGNFMLILTLNMAIIDRFWLLVNEISSFTNALSSIAQGILILQTPIEISDSSTAQELIIDRENNLLGQDKQVGEIIFSRVEFFYKDNKPLFKNINIKIPSGQKVGLVGYSGSGKTTFIHLILRLFDPTSGNILVNRQDIKNIKQESLRKYIGIIPQHPLLFNRSIMENIRYGKLDASDNEVILAAQQACAHEFIELLPNKYNSLVGERGVKLSGGQMQRIAIARVILKDAPILILDEATSHLDSLTENYFQQSLKHFTHNKTTITIAHRLSTIVQMDRILVFNSGKIIEDGTHHELLEKNGLYKFLWDTQIGGFLPKVGYQQHLCKKVRF